MVDQREIVQDVTVDAMTADDIPITFEVAVFHACTDPRRYVYDITDFPVALGRLVETHLRGLIREQTLEAAAGRDRPPRTDPPAQRGRGGRDLGRLRHAGRSRAGRAAGAS